MDLEEVKATGAAVLKLKERECDPENLGETGAMFEMSNDKNK